MKDLETRDQPHIANDTQRTGYEGRQDIGTKNKPEPAHVVHDQDREENRGQCQEKRDGDIDQPANNVSPLEDGNQSTDIEYRQQDQDWQHFPGNSHSEEQPDAQHRTQEQFVGCRFEHHEPAHEHGYGNAPICQSVDKILAGSGDNRPMDVTRRAQYAFSVFSNLNGVMDRMYKSNKSDQFSM